MSMLNGSVRMVTMWFSYCVNLNEVVRIHRHMAESVLLSVWIEYAIGSDNWMYSIYYS